MNEKETRKRLIDPVLVSKGWSLANVGCASPYWREEYPIAPGRIGIDAQHHNPKRADYVLYIDNRPVTVLEAKRDTKTLDDAEGQAKFYAQSLGLRYTYATNGIVLRELDLQTMATFDMNLLDFPTPDELAARLAAIPRSGLEIACAAVPYSRACGKMPRYYQERAIEAVIKRLGQSERHILLNLATGTGKTFIAFQICYLLSQVKWQKDNLGANRPRILFITDRNILAQQAFDDFYFADGDCFRYKAGTNLKLNRYIYFTLFQTLSGEDGTETKFKQFPRDFFDLVIVDECHRGVSNDESHWLSILEYFESAVHLGLTATPKCDENGETYKHFGQPAYVYTLMKGIDDGFLSPYTVKRCESTLSTYKVEEGDIAKFPNEIDPNRTYTTNELCAKHIVILERDRHFVDELFKVMPPHEKAIVFCVDRRHAHRIQSIISFEANRRGISKDPDYCVTVTADTGEYGEQYLRRFRKVSEKIPTILTTSKKLTTGVDSCNLRSIVILRNVNSIIEFKQIVGRGTRVCEGKAQFVIYDYVGATEHINTDEFWSDDPICPRCGKNPCVCDHEHGKGGGVTRVCPVCGLPLAQCTCEKQPQHENMITLSTGRDIRAEWTSFIVFEGELISAQDFLERFIRAVRNAVKDAPTLRAQWQERDTRESFLAELDGLGFTEERLKDIQRNLNEQHCDAFDVILELAYNVEPVTREIRAQRVRDTLGNLPAPQREFASAVLKNYVESGVWTLTRAALTDLVKSMYHTIAEAKTTLGFQDWQGILSLYDELQRRLYAA